MKNRLFLALELNGVIQAWGGHTLEDTRHSEIHPTRSAILGLLAACLGIPRTSTSQLEELNKSIVMAVRRNEPWMRQDGKQVVMTRFVDYHTILGARRVNVKGNEHNPKHTVQSWREYLADAHFSVLISLTEESSLSIDDLERAVKAPLFTPYLGRKSCPITTPLYKATLQASGFDDAFSQIPPNRGVIYSEERHSESDNELTMRDFPMVGPKRQFDTRKIYFWTER